MGLLAPSATEHASKIVCGKCRSKEMRRVSRTLFDQITSHYPYTCNRCGSRERQFRFTSSTVVRVILVLAILGGGIWFWLNPPPFITGAGNGGTSASQQDQAEALARARTAAGGELSTFENMMLRKPKIAMNNATVLKLVKAGVSEDVILQMIRTSNADYDLGANAIIELKEAGVDKTVILAMIDVSYATR